MVLVMVLGLAGSASAERWLVERGRGAGLPADDAWLPAAAEVVVRAKLSELGGVTLLSKADVKSDVVTLELNRLSSAKGATRVTLGKFARARGLIVVDVTGTERRLTLRAIDLTRPDREQTFARAIDARSVDKGASDLALEAAAFLAHRITPDERTRVGRPLKLNRDALVAVARGAAATSDAERDAFFKLATQRAPNAAVAWYLHARALHAAGRTVEAISAYRRAIRLNGVQAVYHYDLGNAFFDEKRYVEAA